MSIFFKSERNSSMKFFLLHRFNKNKRNKIPNPIVLLNIERQFCVILEENWKEIDILSVRFCVVFLWGLFLHTKENSKLIKL